MTVTNLTALVACWLAWGCLGCMLEPPLTRRKAWYNFAAMPALATLRLGLMAAHSLGGRVQIVAGWLDDRLIELAVTLKGAR